MNDYIDYNNEEVSRYPRTVDPREHNVVARIKELEGYKAPIIEDDPVSINQVKTTCNSIEKDIDDDLIIIR